MSFVGYKKYIEEGDTVILFLGFDNMLQLIIEKSKTHQTKYGAIRHRDLLGVQYGSKIQCSKGYAHVLHPTSELWTQNLPHRTQILYSTDISFITLMLDLKPGCVVVESGTGSGSLSHALLRTITPGGFLHTFDFHEQRVEKARQEFVEHGYGESVKVTHKDVLTDGFDLEDVADAVFLDLPAPWDALPHAKKALKKTGGRLCSFSPCIEQVQRVCEILHEIGFSEIQTTECLSRSFDVRTNNMPMPDLGFPWTSTENMNFSVKEDRGGSSHHPVIGQIEIEEFKEHGKHGKRKHNRGQHQSKGGKSGTYKNTTQTIESKSADINTNDKGPTVDGASDPLPQSTAVEDEPAKKQAKTEDNLEKDRPKKQYFDKFTSYVYKTGVPPNQMPGHTGYLTFATLFP